MILMRLQQIQYLQRKVSWQKFFIWISAPVIVTLDCVHHFLENFVNVDFYIDASDW